MRAWSLSALFLLTPVIVRAEASALDSTARGDWAEWRIRSLSCIGLQHSDSVVILRELELTPGAGYSDRMLEEDARAVKNTNLFARLVVSVNPDSTDEAVDIVYAVSERLRYLAFPIISPTEKLGWVYGFGMMNRNLGGRGRRLDLQAEFGEYISYSLYLVDPWFMDQRRPVSLYISRSSHISTNNDYRRQNKEVRLGWTHYFNRETRMGLHPYWQEVTVSDHRAQPEQITRNPLGVDVFGGLALSWERNTTDFHVNPRRGKHLNAALGAFGLAGEKHPTGISGQVSASTFRPVMGELVAGVNLATTFTTGRTAQYMKHYLGGRNRVRVGSSSQWPGWSLCHGSLELRTPLLPRRVYFQHIDFGIGAAAFLDGGLIWEDTYRGGLTAAGGVGLGLRLFAPFIEVGRVDLGWSPSHGMMIQIGQGHAF